MSRTSIAASDVAWCLSRSLMFKIPTTWSISPSITGMRVKPDFTISPSFNSSFTSMTNISARGAMISDALVSSNSNIFSINAFSFSSIPPSSLTTSTKVINSSSVTVGFLWIIPVSLGIKFKNIISGVNKIESQYNGKMTRRAIKMLLRVAMDLGKISPKIKIKKVMTPVAIPTAWLANKSIVIAVAIAEAPTLTRLLPMRMVESSRWGSAFIFFISLLVGPFCLARWIALALLMENRAVSAEEKNPESKSKTNKTTNWSSCIQFPNRVSLKWFADDIPF